MARLSYRHSNNPIATLPRLPLYNTVLRMGYGGGMTMRWQQVSKCINIWYPTVLSCRLYGLLHIILYNFIVLRTWNELTSTTATVSRTANSGNRRTDNNAILYYLDRTISTDHGYSNEMVNLTSLPPRYNAMGRRAIEYKKLILCATIRKPIVSSIIYQNIHHIYQEIDEI